MELDTRAAVPTQTYAAAMRLHQPLGRRVRNLRFVRENL